MWNHFVFRVSSTSFTAFFGSSFVVGDVYIGGGLSPFETWWLWCQWILSWRSWWPVCWDMSGFSISRLLEIWASPVLSVSLGCTWDVEGFVDDDIPLGPFSILFQICDFPSWEVICPLGLISRFLFFFLISSKVVFGFVDSFIVFIWGSYCVWDMLDSCDCNT